MTKCHTRHKTENENVRIYHILKLENCVFTRWIVKIYHTAKTAKKRAALLLAGPPGGGVVMQLLGVGNTSKPEREL